MLVEHGIKLKHGIRFTDIEIDHQGFITLDLRTAVINRLSVTRQLRESQKDVTDLASGIPVGKDSEIMPPRSV